MASEQMNEQVKTRHKHARKCKKPFGECGTCEQNITWFRQLSLTDLSVALDDRTGGGK